MFVADCLEDVALVFDHSSSIGATDWQLITDFMARFISSTDVGEDAMRIGAVSYGTRLNFEIKKMVSLCVYHVI